MRIKSSMIFSSEYSNGIVSCSDSNSRSKYSRRSDR